MRSFFLRKPRAGLPLAMKGLPEGLADMDECLWNLSVLNGFIDRTNPRAWIIVPDAVNDIPPTPDDLTLNKTSEGKWQIYDWDIAAPGTEPVDSDFVVFQSNGDRSVKYVTWDRLKNQQDSESGYLHSQDTGLWNHDNIISTWVAGWVLDTTNDSDNPYHRWLRDMPDAAGTNGDHDARYWKASAAGTDTKSYYTSGECRADDFRLNDDTTNNYWNAEGFSVDVSGDAYISVNFGLTMTLGNLGITLDTNGVMAINGLKTSDTGLAANTIWRDSQGYVRIT